MTRDPTPSTGAPARSDRAERLVLPRSVLSHRPPETGAMANAHGTNVIDGVS
jgi:hypothetical protein